MSLAVGDLGVWLELLGGGVFLQLPPLLLAVPSLPPSVLLWCSLLSPPSLGTWCGVG